MMRDALIIVAVILVLITFIVMFGGCVSCSNGRYDNEGMNSVTTPSGTDPSTMASPLIPTPPKPMVVAPTSSPAVNPTGGIVGYDTSGADYATFRLSS